MLEKQRKQVEAFDYPNGDHLQLDVKYAWCRESHEAWEASITSIQRRGFCDFVGIVTSNSYAATPEAAADKAIALIPKDWAFEPNKVAIKTKGQASWYAPIPVKREAA